MRNFGFPRTLLLLALWILSEFLGGYRNPRLGITHFLPPPSPLWSAYLSQCLLFPTQMNRVKCTFSTQANMEGGGLYLRVYTYFFCHFSYCNIWKRRLGSQIIYWLSYWNGLGPGVTGDLSPPCPATFFTSVYTLSCSTYTTELQYVLGPATLKMKSQYIPGRFTPHQFVHKTTLNNVT